jgi:toxin CcdB
MARFDLHRVDTWHIPLLVNVQADILDGIASRVVIPLRAIGNADEPPLPKLKPVLFVDGQHHVLVTTDIGAQPLRWLGKPIGNIKEHRNTIIAAMDFLFQGY